MKGLTEMMGKFNLKVRLALAVGLALFCGCLFVGAERDCGTGAVRTKTIDLPGGESREMVWCPQADGFWIGKYEVTQRQWASMVRALCPIKDAFGVDIVETPSSFSSANGPLYAWDDTNAPPARADRPFTSASIRYDEAIKFDVGDFPVESVSWDDCVRVIEALNQNRTDGFVFALPTEAQWEFAARGGAKSRGFRYSGGDDLDALGWYYQNSGKARMDEKVWDEDRMRANGSRPHDVKEKPAGNELGIVGMSGNVWEFCLDDEARGKVIRGGCWMSPARDCRVSARSGTDSKARSEGVGFRLVCVEKPSR